MSWPGFIYNMYRNEYCNNLKPLTTMLYDEYCKPVEWNLYNSSNILSKSSKISETN